MPTVPESERTYIDYRRLQLLACCAGFSLREVERRLGLAPTNLFQMTRRGWLRRQRAQEVAEVLGCTVADFEVRHAD